MNRTKFLVILAMFAVASAVLIVYALRSKQTGAASARDLPPASEAGTRLPDRRFHIINLSLPRTGTKSISGLFIGNFRSEHEYMYIETLTHIFDWREGRISDEAFDAFLLERDHRIRPEVDSTSVLYLAQDRLFSLSPDAKFLFVVRNGADWLVSMLDKYESIQRNFKEKCTKHCSDWIIQTNRLARSISPSFRPEEYYRDLEHLDTNIGPILPDIAAFWGNWTLTTLRNLGRLPHDRVLVIRTQNIDSSLDKLSAFAGIAKTELTIENHHLNRARRTHDFTKLIGEDRIAVAFQPWQMKVDAQLREMGVE